MSKLKFHDVENETVSQRAKRLWPHITAGVMYSLPDPDHGDEWRAGVCSYKTIARRSGMDGDYDYRKVRYGLGQISAYCKMHGLPPLNALVVLKNTGKSGDGIPQADVDRMNEALNYDWRKVVVPSAGDFRKAVEYAVSEGWEGFA